MELLNTFETLLIAVPLLIAAIGCLSIPVIEVIEDKKNNN